jgi:hypothetical protein
MVSQENQNGRVLIDGLASGFRVFGSAVTIAPSVGWEQFCIQRQAQRLRVDLRSVDGVCGAGLVGYPVNDCRPGAVALWVLALSQAEGCPIFSGERSRPRSRIVFGSRVVCRPPGYAR